MGDPAGTTCPSFDRFWAAFPRRVAKVQAQKAWAQLKPSEAMVEQMLTALTWQATQQSWTRDGGAYIPYPASWIRGRRWEDEPPATARAQRACTHQPPCSSVSQCGRMREIDEALKDGRISPAEEARARELRR